MTKFTLTLLTLMLLPFVATADEVNEAEARQRAETFLQERGRGHLPLMQQSPTGIKKSPGRSSRQPYFVFNVAEDKGFVVVSGDDRTIPILGYADQGTFSDDDATMPDGLRYLLDGYAEQLEWLDEHPTEVRSANRTSTSRHAIAPLIKTRWNQGAPYNLKCPLTSDHEATVTGCVATSMAQVMYYHQHPTASSAIPAYTTPTLKLPVTALESTSFDWDNMLPTYNSSATDAQKTAIATLMQYCGTALQMDYNTSASGGSSAYNVSIVEVLKMYFGYSNDAQTHFRCFYSYNEWIDLIYGELADGRPVILAGQSTDGGHSFVCDGYDADDYFHINWGWGGQSDGFFRLSVLDPYEQGIGGSSTLDGFSYSQEVATGLHPATAGEEEPYYCLSLENGLLFSASSGETQKTFSRSSASEDFTDIPFYFTLWHYLPGTRIFDYALQLIDGSGNVAATVLEEDNLSIAFNTKKEVSTETAAFGSGLADGTYSLKVMSRLNGTSTWRNCYGTNAFTMQAVIDGNSLTVTAPRLMLGNRPTLVSIETEATPIAGNEVNVIVTLSGVNADFHDNLILYADGTQKANRIMGRQADIPVGETVQVRFSYLPETAGIHTLYVYASGSEIGQKDITVESSDATMCLTLNPFVQIINLSDGKLYGNALRATITMKNESEDFSYVGQVNCSVRKYTEQQKIDDGDDYDAQVKNYKVSIPKNNSLDIPVSVDGLETGYYYRLRITYYTVTDGKKAIAANDLLTDFFLMDEGYLVCATDGTTTPYQKSSNIEFANALYVDLTGINDWSGMSITPSSNPNCLYLLPSGASTPSGLSGKNVICGTTAATIALQDGFDFYSPIDFTAESISYSRTFTVPAARSSGWNTIMLPFDVSQVSVSDGSGEKTVDWFHSASDTGKNFWLKTFTGDDTGYVYFNYADRMTANTPYIIAVPGNDWGDEWRMTNKTVTFSGTNATVKATTQGMLSGNHFKFCGTTVNTTLADVYALNSEGSSFKKNGNITIDPFRAWISAASVSSLTMPALTIASGLPNAIDAPAVRILPTVGAIYDLQGRKLPIGRGLYIQNNKKHIAK